MLKKRLSNQPNAAKRCYGSPIGYWQTLFAKHCSVTVISIFLSFVFVKRFCRFYAFGSEQPVRLKTLRYLLVEFGFFAYQ